MQIDGLLVLSQLNMWPDMVLFAHHVAEFIFCQLLQVLYAEQGQMRMRLLFMGIWQHCISSSSSSYTWKAVHNQQLPLPMLWMSLILVMGFKLFAHLIPAMGAQSIHDCPWRFLT